MDLNRQFESNWAVRDEQAKVAEAERQAKRQANAMVATEATDLARAMYESIRDQLSNRLNWRLQAVEPTSVPYLEAPGFITDFTMPHSRKDKYTLWMDIWKDHTLDIENDLRTQLHERENRVLEGETPDENSLISDKLDV
jgi:hypothetical protein